MIWFVIIMVRAWHNSWEFIWEVISVPTRCYLCWEMWLLTVFAVPLVKQQRVTQSHGGAFCLAFVPSSDACGLLGSTSIFNLLKILLEIWRNICTKNTITDCRQLLHALKRLHLNLFCWWRLGFYKCSNRNTGSSYLWSLHVHRKRNISPWQDFSEFIALSAGGTMLC